MKKIEIPLFLYSGKILQNHHRGQGVFIKEVNKQNTKIRFIAERNTENDIINSFSSGQLSAFIISFMLVMNKLYTGNTNILNFLLIDDPMQTMDDINMTSFVEILRNEFPNKHIILSTHEYEKAYYIMYKFKKYGFLSNSYNVKKELHNA